MLQFEATREEAAGLIHDLGNLIQIASSAVNVLARNPRFQNDEIEPVIAGAQSPLEAASALVRHNLNSMRASLSAQSVHVGNCIAEIERLVGLSWDLKFRLHSRIGTNLPSVKCDPAGLRNAILNLLFNARDAMPDGGDIVLGVIARENEIDIVVADNGVGMSVETLARALDPLFTTKSDGLGGLGLPSVERFARSAGGRVRVESKLGVGTMVLLQLPASSG